MLRILFFFLCTSVFTLSKAQVPMYKVTKIKKVRNYYVIYASKNDTICKIISKREKIDGCESIRENKSYPFKIAKIKAMGGSEVDCFSFDKRTVFCKEPEAELALASNLKGLCLIDQ